MRTVRCEVPSPLLKIVQNAVCTESVMRNHKVSGSGRSCLHCLEPRKYTDEEQHLLALLLKNST